MRNEASILQNVHVSWNQTESQQPSGDKSIAPSISHGVSERSRTSRQHVRRRHGFEYQTALVSAGHTSPGTSRNRSRNRQLTMPLRLCSESRPQSQFRPRMPHLSCRRRAQPRIPSRINFPHRQRPGKIRIDKYAAPAPSHRKQPRRSKGSLQRLACHACFLSLQPTVAK
ncbi:hypothetical protein CI102_12715 [Trichoderma harzianum]|uniref:Uncharacterized protein n=1 Tax=Trichoderma harzianum CBS 226.95 TaxID=983964 RepID=A0A2T4AGE6_TRIHA|nr:hypothetical protein M431DRAFT_507781 [Trichoderma harzianum CBS 226.95]PKK43042.1 hypothetical protein CI102_12715 [Trichoderma harzianum]PTB56136.1 hypothetical protein M431DRAFT_507781 [Trichoderma harzianum CBS 226.95]